MPRPRVTTGRAYWQHTPRPGPQLAQSICVIGSGETAASVVIDLLRRAHKRSTVDVDLSVAGLTPAPHLPMLAGLAQGPGFPNLSCLGLLSDRVLRRYVPLPPDGPLAGTADRSAARALERSEHV
jgi:hypothetical protein